MGDLSLLWQGFWLGLAIAAPVGPVGVLCIRRTLSNGRLSGWVSGLGAATADAIYGGLAAFGLAVLADFLLAQQTWLSLLGGAFLFYLGLRIFLSRPDAARAAVARQPLSGLLGDYLSTLLLTLTNPITVIYFVGIFAGLGPSSTRQISQAMLLVTGFFMGSALWWTILSLGAGFLRKSLDARGLLWINRLSGGLILGFALLILWGLFQPPAKTLSATLLPGAAEAAAQPAAIAGFARATGDQPLVFPADHGPHPDYQTEWWYYTGNLTTAEGRRFGYQLTFFRRALIPPPARTARPSAWAAEQAYLAHFALTDVGGDRHYSFERLERGAVGVAGGQAEPFGIWLQDWQVSETAPGMYYLQAAVPAAEGQPALRLELTLTDTKGLVLQGDQGYSRKGPEAGNASYYYSLTRLQTRGSLTLDGAAFALEGFSWMDHEYSTSALSEGQVGWDWFSIQLDGERELMVFQIRRADGSVDAFSSGMLIEPDGSLRRLSREDFEIVVQQTWRSPLSAALYPSKWLIRIPSAGLELELQPLVADQEMDLQYTYWEGAVRVSGSLNGNPLQGFGYVELTGYSGSMAGEF